MDEQFFQVFVKKKIVKFLQLELLMKKTKNNNFNRKNFHFELMESFMKKQREGDQRYSMETYSLEYIYS